MDEYRYRWVNTRAKSSEPVALARHPMTVGHSIMEFALIAPLLLFAISGIIDIARLIQAQVTPDNAARQTIRFAIRGRRYKDANGSYICAWIPSPIWPRNAGNASCN